MATLKATYSLNNTVHEIKASTTDVNSLEQLTTSITSLKSDLNEYLTAVMRNNDESLEVQQDIDEDEDDDEDEEQVETSNKEDDPNNQQAKKQKVSP